MRIAIVTELYPPHVGGQEFRYAELAQALLRSGHSVDVYTIRHAPELARDEVVDGVRVMRFPLAKDYKKPLIEALKRRQRPLWLYSIWTRLRMRHQDYDLFLFNQFPFAHILLASAAIRRKTVIDWCELRNNRVFSFLQRKLPKLVAANIAVSLSLATRLEEMCGVPVHCIPSGIWEDSYRGLPRGERSGLLFVGRITEHKNLPLLVRAFECLRDRGYKGPLTITGGGPALNDVQELARQSKYADSIRFPGVVDEEQKRDLLASSEVLVISSRREGFPRVVAEAMASGLPVATTDFAENGTKDVVRQYNIGLVSQSTPEALAEAVFTIGRRWETYSAKGLASCHELSWSTLVRSLEHLSEIRLGIARAAVSADSKGLQGEALPEDI